MTKFARLRRSGALPDVIIGVAMVLLAVAMAMAITTIRTSPGYAYVGPRVFPFAVALFLGLVGMGLAISAFLGVDGSNPAAVPDTSPEKPGPTMAWVVGGLIANLVGLALLGFVFAAIIQYVMTARGFGSRRWRLDAVCGLALASCAYFLFSEVLKVNIPAGPVLELIHKWII
jgi:putative tricarboxylic transport membrane protein